MLSNTCDAKHRYFVAYLPTFRICVVIHYYHNGNKNIADTKPRSREVAKPRSREVAKPRSREVASSITGII